MERFLFQTTVLSYAAFIVSPYFIPSALGPFLVLFFGCAALCLRYGKSIDAYGLSLWNRLKTPNHKAAAYFAAAFAPMLWWPSLGFRASVTASFFFLGVFAAPACLKGLSSGSLAGFTLFASLLFGSLASIPGFPGDVRTVSLLTLSGLLLVLIPYCLLFLLFIRFPKWVLGRRLLQTTWMDAVEKGDAGLIRRLIAAGKDVNESSGDETPLHWAAGAGKDDIVLLLLEKGAFIDPKNGALQTPLMMAARRGNAESVRLLIKNGADLDARDAQDQTALDQAQNHGHHEVAKVLHQAKKDRI